MRTQQEIDDEIAKLEELKPFIPEFSLFGDKNHVAIEAQIQTLEEGLDFEQCFQYFYEDGSDYVVEEARTAHEWATGKRNTVPSESWDALDRRKQQHKKACRECPWRKDSARGYLGTSNPVEFLQVSESGARMPCHLTIDYERDNWKNKVDTAPQCAGRAAHFANRCKVEAGVLQVAKDDNVFFNPQDFINHHTVSGEPPQVMIIGKRVVV